MFDWFQICPHSRKGQVLLYQISLRPDGGALHWRAGDVLDLRPQGSGWKREYYVASSPGEGLLKLIVRQQFREDGSLGLGCLTERFGEGGAAEESAATSPSTPRITAARYC